MRTVSFSNSDVRDSLNRDFTATYTDTTGDPSAGLSFSHSPNDTPGNCGFGAGRQNVQSIFMTPEGEIFHIASGFRSGDDLLKEIDFAKSVYQDVSDAKTTDRGSSVVNAQLKRLRSMGFSDDELNDGRTGIMRMLPKNSGMDFAPQDLGMNIESGTGLFEDMISQRVLADGRFVAKYPLMSKPEFEANVVELVGKHKSFFGSHEMMNGLTGDNFKSLPDRNRRSNTNRMSDFDSMFDSDTMKQSDSSRDIQSKRTGRFRQ